MPAASWLMNLGFAGSISAAPIHARVTLSKENTKTFLSIENTKILINKENTKIYLDKET